MILDARRNEVRLDRDATVVVVGAGPAGIVLARELAGVADVLLIEAGGEAEEPWLLEGESDGLNYPLGAVRARQLGGSSALWAGYCAAFEREDFMPRPSLPFSGWPIGETTLVPFHERAAAAMGVAPETGDDPIEQIFDTDTLRVGRWTFGRSTRRFAEDAPGLVALAGLEVLTHAAVVDIVLSPGHDAVRELVVRTAESREGRIRAKHVVLACGGIETPRLLLAANGQVPTGIGNAGGMVGLCFMEHPHRVISGVRLKPADFFERSARRVPRDETSEQMLNFGLPAALRHQLGLLNARAHAFRHAAMDDGDPPLLGLMMEQAPNPASRVRLSDGTDRVGLRRARLHWQLSELDHRSFVATAGIVAAELERAGLAEVTGPEVATAEVGYCCHQLGTTRMSTDPLEGVTDANCRVHGVGNLHIAGGSLFPTSSWANPTFTVLALALRLADRLKGELGVPMLAATQTTAPSHAKEFAQ